MAKHEKKSAIHKKNSESTNHKALAGNVEGYGEPYPTAVGMKNEDEKTN